MHMKVSATRRNSDVRSLLAAALGIVPSDGKQEVGCEAEQIGSVPLNALVLIEFGANFPEGRALGN